MSSCVWAQTLIVSVYRANMVKNGHFWNQNKMIGAISRTNEFFKNLFNYCLSIEAMYPHSRQEKMSCYPQPHSKVDIIL